MNAIAELDFRLLNDYQHAFPLCSTPYRCIAAQLNVDEIEVLDACQRLGDAGRISRIGAVFAPRRIGASTLAALAVPPARLDAVAARVSAFPGVNHNYEREHAYNLWFVVTAASAGRLAATLAEIESACGLPVLCLPLEAEYHIDLGFALERLHSPGAGEPAAARPPLCQGADPALPAASLQRPHATERAPTLLRLDASGQALVGALQGGLPLCPRPYATIARRLGLAETAVLLRIRAWLDSGVLKRFGVVVRHRELGFTANAMLVHDIPDALVDDIGRRLGEEAPVTLCYRRPRVAPSWPYNLFCMIHGRQRDAVETSITDLRRRLGLEDYPHAILFSKTRYKQQGACYVEPQAATVAA